MQRTFYNDKCHLRLIECRYETNALQNNTDSQRNLSILSRCGASIEFLLSAPVLRVATRRTAFFYST